MAKSWQQSLLSSGLPLENDVKRYLDSKGCITGYEYSYLKPDETKIERQFSYDIDGTYVRDSSFVTFMVECKYRHPGTQWVFTPDTYGGPSELDPTAFVHPIDDFVPASFPFRGTFPKHLAPACGKGTEVMTHGNNEKSITQALTQLAYAFAPKVAEAIEHQAFRYLLDDYIFFHIPVVATTAELLRLRDDVAIEKIRAAKLIEDIAIREPCLVMNYAVGIELEKYNAQVFANLRKRIGDEALRRAMQTHVNNLDNFFAGLARSHAPRAVVFVAVDKNQKGFEKVFAYVDELLRPSKELLAEIKAQERETRRQLRAFERRRKAQKKTK